MPRKPRLCPKCRKGTRIQDVRTIQGFQVDASYCGWCGVNWPVPSKGGTS